MVTERQERTGRVVVMEKKQEARSKEAVVCFFLWRKGKTSGVGVGVGVEVEVVVVVVVEEWKS